MQWLVPDRAQSGYQNTPHRLRITSCWMTALTALRSPAIGSPHVAVDERLLLSAVADFRVWIDKYHLQLWLISCRWRTSLFNVVAGRVSSGFLCKGSLRTALGLQLQTPGSHQNTSHHRWLRSLLARCVCVRAHSRFKFASNNLALIADRERHRVCTSSTTGCDVKIVGMPCLLALKNCVAINVGHFFVRWLRWAPSSQLPLDRSRGDIL